MKLFGLYDNKGKLFDVSDIKGDAWFSAFHYQSEAFKKKFWRKFGSAQIRATKKLGWKVIPGRFVPDQKQ